MFYNIFIVINREINAIAVLRFGDKGESMDQYEMVRRAFTSVREKTDFVPEIAIVLGSGLGELASCVQDPVIIPSEEIDCYPRSTVSGHMGHLIFGTFSGRKVVVQQGRIHYYEGYDMSEVVLPVRLMCALGAQKVILTNAAGGVNQGYRPGDFMAIKGQIASFVPSPLRGANDETFGTRFPDMTEIYSPSLISLARECARALGIPLREGVYLQASGPNYESPEEIRAFRILGADAVGMSTAVEAIAARHMGRSVLGVSLITNMASGMDRPLSHEEVKETADRAGERFIALVKSIVAKI